MSCPYYVDFTRTCIEHFPEVREYSSYSVCESEGFTSCLAYIALKTGYLCKYHKQCLLDLITEMPILVKFFIEDEKTVKLFKSMAEKYCTSEENNVRCACFQLFEKGIHPPTELLPDGKKIRLRDLLFKKEIVVE
ncbi:MAG TPA: hypothetical protein VMT57_03310 [Candidatus Thermoplasmatota archaeon]|nr:hypothetical protein [Candidatus Thermoplasmatota archaeon]